MKKYGLTARTARALSVLAAMAGLAAVPLAMSGCDTDGAVSAAREASAQGQEQAQEQPSARAEGRPVLLLTGGADGGSYAVELHSYQGGGITDALWRERPAGLGVSTAEGSPDGAALINLLTYSGASSVSAGPYLLIVTEAGSSQTRYRCGFTLGKGSNYIDWNSLAPMPDTGGGGVSGTSVPGTGLITLRNVRAGSFVTAEVYGYAGAVTGHLSASLRARWKAAIGRAAADGTEVGFRLEAAEGGLFADSGVYMLVVTERTPAAGLSAMRYNGAVVFTDGGAEVSLGALAEVPPDSRDGASDYRTISFVTDSAAVAPVFVPNNGAAAAPPEPAKHGAAFDGWFTEGGDRYGFGLPVTADITLNARWSGEYRTVNFADGGAIPAQYLSAGHFAAPPPQPTRADDAFTGWFADSGFGTPYNFSAPVTADIVLYARWSPMAAAVFDPQNEGSQERRTVKAGSRLAEPALPSRAGYVFEGWFMDGAADAWDFAADRIEADITLNAKWTFVPVASYGIMLDIGTVHTFADATEGYAAGGFAKAVGITNTGSGPTGDIAIIVSGTDAAAFTVSQAAISGGITASGGTASFTVAPAAGLRAGTHNATVTVTAANAAAANAADGGFGTCAFNVSFGVYAKTEYGIRLDASGTHFFPQLTAGYGQVSVKTVRIENTGYRDTGVLTVSVSTADFELSATTITSIPAGGYPASFSVSPKLGLAAGTHNATITVRAGAGTGASASFEVSFPVGAAKYGFSLDKADATHTFADATVGYSVTAAMTASVANTGNQGTGPLDIGLSGANPSAFSLSANTVSIPAGGDAVPFTVVPKPGLSAGTYTAAVTIAPALGSPSYNAGVAAKSFNVRFTVSAYGINLDLTAWTFPTAMTGYTPTPKTVRVSNTGSQATGTLNISLSGTNPQAFSLSKAQIAGIAAGAEATFTVAPAAGLSAGTYSGVVTVASASASANISARSFTVRFTAASAVYGIALSEAGTYVFPAATAPYGTQAAKTVFVTNTGSMNTGTLQVGLSGADASAFSLSKAQIAGIAAGSAPASFTVVPVMGLDVGLDEGKTYNATVRVSGGNNISASFNVSFTVNAEPTYGILLDTSSVSFPDAVEGYTQIDGSTVRISKTGNQPIGSLMLSSSSDNFTVTPAVITNALNETTFMIRPKTGLAAELSRDKTYETVVSVTGEHGISASLSASFTVKRRFYTVSFNLNGAAGTAPASQSIPRGNCAAEPDVPSYADWGFEGWFTEAGSGGREWNFLQDPVTEARVLYARWSVVVGFDANGGVGSAPPQTIAPGTRVTPPFVPTMTHYTFSGWYNNPASQGQPVSFSAPVYECLTFYAAWTPVTYTITMNRNEGYWEGAPGTYLANHGGPLPAVIGRNTYTAVYNTVFAIPDAPIIREGYSFQGWYTDSQLTNKVSSVTVTGNTQLYAKWQKEANVTVTLKMGLLRSTNSGIWTGYVYDVPYGGRLVDVPIDTAQAHLYDFSRNYSSNYIAATNGNRIALAFPLVRENRLEYYEYGTSGSTRFYWGYRFYSSTLLWGNFKWRAWRWGETTNLQKGLPPEPGWDKDFP
jgi:uncharacterized repeat protein (TIGR02543 family)